MPHEIIMPALGMAQDTGKLVNWLKYQGDEIKTGDVLFEVETDKSTMEVDAQADGYLTNVTAKAGDDVPVGNVIAYISDAPGDSAAPANEPDAPVAAAEPEALPAPEAEAEPTPIASTPTPPARSSGKILASPKAKKAAAELSLDLADLAAHGTAQPFHMSDIETLKNLPTKTAASVPQTGAVPAVFVRMIGAEAKRKGIKQFIDWMQNDGDIALELSHIWASYAAACLRKVLEANDKALVLDMIKRDDHAHSETEQFVDADKQRLSKMVANGAIQVADFIIADITETGLTQMRSGAQNAPRLTIGKAKKKYILSLEYTADQMTDDQAVAFVADFCARIDDPLKHVL